jgi:HTH-type transcriptional regulator/antitoxin HipB
MKPTAGQIVVTPNQLGAVLRARRKASGVTQDSAAATLGISQSRLSMLEQHPEGLTLDRLLALASLLGLELVVRERRDRPARKTEW